MIQQLRMLSGAALVELLTGIANARLAITETILMCAHSALLVLRLRKRRNLAVMEMAPMIVSVLLYHSLIAVLEADAGVHMHQTAQLHFALVSRATVGLAQLRVHQQHEGGIS